MTYSARFDACLAEVLKWEGGWANDAYDPGGPTNKGITLGVYAGWVGAGDAGLRDDYMREELTKELRAIDDATVAAIYHKNYWLAVRGDELPPGIDLAVFDFAVNSGPPRAIRHLQKVLGVGIDGHIGPRTLEAARAADPARVIPQLMDSRRTFLRQIKHFWRFGTGWLRRVDGVQGNAMASIPTSIFGASDSPAGSRTLAPRTTPPVSPPPLPGAWETTAMPASAKASDNEAATMSGSPTGRAAEVAGGVSGAQTGVEIASAAARARGADGAFDVIAFVLALAQSPTFWLAAGGIATAAYLWLRERRRMAVL